MYTGQSWITEGIGGGVAALQSDLMRPFALKSDEEVFIHAQTAVGVSIDLGKPSPHPVGVELLIPGGVQRVGQIDPAPVAAQLHHLCPTVERASLGMGRARRCLPNEPTRSVSA